MQQRQVLLLVAVLSSCLLVAAGQRDNDDDFDDAGFDDSGYGNSPQNHDTESSNQNPSNYSPSSEEDLDDDDDVDETNMRPQVADQQQPQPQQPLYRQPMFNNQPSYYANVAPQRFYSAPNSVLLANVDPGQQQYGGQHMRYRRAANPEPGDIEDATQRPLNRLRRHSKYIGPVYTYVKTDKHAHYKWGVKHKVGKKHHG